jgi:metallophosphoesterase (TIGR00282 family)
LKILYIADVYAKPGRKAVLKRLPYYIETEKVTFTIANGENIAGGFGLTQNLADKLFRYGINCITSGNHIWDRRDILPYLESRNDILRPANYPPGVSGKGATVLKSTCGTPIGVLNLEGRTYMHSLDCPFRVAIEEIEKLKRETEIIIVDFHAEATSEKRAMGFFLDGKVSAVIGSHTHIQTADEEILPNGTGYITDAGMTGAHKSVIGVKPHLAIQHFLTQINVRFEPAEEEVHFCGVILEIDEASGKTISIKRINEIVKIDDTED